MKSLKNLLINACICLALSCIHLPLKAQSINCRQFRTGTFSITSNGKTTIIKRYSNRQLEYFDHATKPITFHLKWIDECTYTLKPEASFFKNNPEAPKNSLLTVVITKASQNSYTMRATSNFSDDVMVAEVKTIK